MTAQDETLLKQLGALARREHAAQVLSDVSQSTVAATAARVLRAMEQQRSPMDRLAELLRRLKKHGVILLAVPASVATVSVWCLVQAPHAAHYELSVLQVGGVMRGANSPGGLEVGPEVSDSAVLRGGRVELLLRPQSRAEQAPDIHVWRRAASGLVPVAAIIQRDPRGSARLALDLPADTQRVVVATCADPSTAPDGPELACGGQRWILPVTPQ